MAPSGSSAMAPKFETARLEAGHGGRLQCHEGPDLLVAGPGHQQVPEGDRDVAQQCRM